MRGGMFEVLVMDLGYETTRELNLYEEVIPLEAEYAVEIYSKIYGKSMTDTRWITKSADGSGRIIVYDPNNICFQM